MIGSTTIIKLLLLLTNMVVVVGSIDYNNRTRRYIAIQILIDQVPNDPDLTRVFGVAVPNSSIDQINVFGQCEGLTNI